MSEFLAEASVLIQANTVAFRKELAAALATVPKVVPIEIVATGSGSLSAAAKTAKQEAQSLALATGNTVDTLKEEKDAATRAGAGLHEHEREVRKLTESERKFARNAAEVRKGLVAQAASAAGLRGAIIGANSAFILATAGAIAFGKSLQSAAQFQTELATFAATTGATADQMREVSDAAKQLGEDITLPGVNAQDAAVAMTELAKAGLDVQESIGGARGVLQLATAAQIDNAAATELAASALNAFGLTGNQAVHVADVLANAANDAQGSITDIGIALQQASAAGRQSGLSLEDTAGILTIFARNGIKGSDAGTLLRTMLIRLINPTDKANKVIRDLGLNLRDSTGGINLGFFDEFAQKTKNLSTAERDRDAAIIAGQDAFRGLSILAREGGASLDAQITSLNKTGTAAQLAAARTSGLAGSAENLKNQLSTLGLTVGQLVSPALQNFADTAASTVSSVNNLTQSLSKPIAELLRLKNALRDATSVSVFGLQFSPLDLGFVPKQVKLAISAAQAVLDDNPVELNIAAARGSIQGLVADLNKVGGATKLNETVLQLKEIQKQFAGGDEKSKQFADSVGKFIAQLQNLGATRTVLPPIEFPKNLDAGAKPAIEQAVRQATGIFGDSFRPSIENVFADASNAGWQAFQDAGAKAAAQAAATISAALRSSRLQAGALASEKIKLEFQGASQQEIRANLEETLKAQNATVAALLKRPDAKRSAIDAARQNAIQTQSQIEAIDEAAKAAAETAVNKAEAAARERTAKAKAAAQKIQRERDAADQAIFDALTGGQNRINLAQIDANATARLSDDIAVQKLIANTASREIAIIDKSVKDVKARNAAIAARVQILKAAAAELDRLRKEQADAQATKAQTARDAVTTNLEKKLQLAQIIGKKDPILTAFDALIANERKNLAAAKKADKLDALIKLRQTIKDRNDFLEDIKKDAADGVKQATTAFDLLTQFSQTFNQNAGNLINGNQPFAGPTGFTADIAQFLIRRQAKPQAATSPFPGKATDDKLVSSQTSLTDAILSLRDTIANTQGNKSTAFGTVDTGVGSIAQRWHRANQMQRQFQEA